MKIYISMLALALIGSILYGMMNRSKIIDLKSNLEQLTQELAQSKNRLTEQEDEMAGLEELLAFSQSNSCNETANAHKTSTTKAASSAEPKPPTGTQQALSDMHNKNLQQVVGGKYHILFSELSVSDTDAEKLRILLIDRERVANATTVSYYTDDLDSDVAVTQQKRLLEEVDDKIERLLGRDEFDRYEMVKDSEFEQYQVRKYDSVLTSEKILTEDQTRSLVFAKLKHKRAYTEAIEEGDALAREGKKHQAIKVFEDAVLAYQKRYLQDAQIIVTDEQFKDLSVYEKKQFQQILDSLRVAHD